MLMKGTKSKKNKKKKAKSKAEVVSDIEANNESPADDSTPSNLKNVNDDLESGQGTEVKSTENEERPLEDGKEDHGKSPVVNALAGPNDVSKTATDERLHLLDQERESLREEVTEARKSLESLQQKHEEQLGHLRQQLSTSTEDKEAAQTQYNSLLGRVNTIKAQLGDRLKADAVSRSMCYLSCNLNACFSYRFHVIGLQDCW